MTVKQWHVRLILAILAAASAIIAFVTISEPWYRSDESYVWGLVGPDRTYRWEYVFHLDEWTRTLYVDGHESTVVTYSYSESTLLWFPLEPMNSFMNAIEILVWLGGALAMLTAILAVLGHRTYGLLTCGASVALLASALIVFLLGFVNACNDTDFPDTLSDLESFLGEETDTNSTRVWGPLSAWWLMLMACAVQCTGLLLALRLWGRGAQDQGRSGGSRTAQRTRPSRSP